MEGVPRTGQAGKQEVGVTGDSGSKKGPGWKGSGDLTGPEPLDSGSWGDARCGCGVGSEVHGPGGLRILGVQNLGIKNLGAVQCLEIRVGLQGPRFDCSLGYRTQGCKV